MQTVRDPEHHDRFWVCLTIAKLSFHTDSDVLLLLRSTHLAILSLIVSGDMWQQIIAKCRFEVRVSDLLCIDHDGNVVAGGRPENKIYNTAAFAIHAQIHKARPDANAACHSHSIYGKGNIESMTAVSDDG